VKTANWISFVITSLSFLGLTFWLVGGSIWLDIFLTGALTSVAILSRQLKASRILFDIADKELVRVSALASALEQQVEDLGNKLDNSEAEISDLKADK
jgi:hypothetical protein